MDDLGAQYGPLDHAVGQVHATADALIDERQSLSTSMHSMLDGEWTGGAASAFRDAFDEWEHGAQTVLDGLKAMSQLIAEAKKRLQTSDEHGQQGIAALQSRLGPV